MNKKNSVKMVLLIGLLAVFGCGKKQLDLIGTWQVNPEKTSDQLVKSGKITKDKKELWAKRLKERDPFKITISKGKITTVNYEFDYETVSQTASEVVLKTKSKGTWTFTDVGDGSIRIKNTLNLYSENFVWDKVPGKAVTKKNRISTAEKDKAGKTPYDYAEEYYAATNRGDIEAIRVLYTKEYYKRVVTKYGFLKTPEPNLFKKHLNKRLFKHSSITLEFGGVTKSNAPGGFTVGYLIMFTKEYAQQQKSKSAGIHDSICFRMEDGLWRIAR